MNAMNAMIAMRAMASWQSLRRGDPWVARIDVIAGNAPTIPMDTIASGRFANRPRRIAPPYTGSHRIYAMLSEEKHLAE
ncbi:MAG TPA: hypothetical protein VGJ87_03670 [Roseiflexaceae bacterium]|jgi:hypothetical protein